MATHVKAVINHDCYQTKVEAGTNSIIADEGTEAGGANKGMSPFELLASSLAACTCITLRMYIDKKEWDIGSIEVNVNMTRDDVRETTHFERSIAFSGKVDDAQ